MRLGSPRDRPPDPNTTVTPVDAMLRLLQRNTGLPEVGCQAKMPTSRDAFPVADNAPPEASGPSVVLSAHDVRVLTLLLSQASRKHSGTARPSSGRLLQASLKKQFSDRSDVFDKATQEYMLDLTETKVCCARRWRLGFIPDTQQRLGSVCHRVRVCP